MGSDDVSLIRQGFSGYDFAVLYDASGVSEDVIDCAGDGAITVELSVCVGVQSVLVSVYLTLVEYRLIRLD